ncbi:1-(5-phosphoribosyl)-5-[(5-phosphoribosylamino)methylideneamino]imidazole-4-carboxamide isomerase [Paraliomyxa miuraensis]|uniref:1-(5-phosphoribosyl)-5-[(5- phosphoribosylamino)methylideneamino]imidazole-4- carboxamide isomerase n=1 Tax=Paraliomyxa miuraensis TaxID=376150 RepID=UPI00225758B8|nr:1-(5-phosphoribosyl)-5-[(5-phosphoribosylamino)methylideneamino]imidazole-4-carboxamide isomerase [Paraliomyxa miuraensis]MCX4240657.1 1-(5-phosphoribosyl)-5-[(5-phosphoribosylamino)methylideneamino]imidazole-4-carboxamide isomerase [Paraliomyxa miuraensis]
MIVIPAIDLQGGKAVRLEQGEASRATVYEDRPTRLATSFARAGAQRIHVVDLDGAFAGRPQQLELVARLSDAALAHGATVQAGGGIRDAQSVESLLSVGVGFVVVGTLAVREPALVQQLCERYPGQIIVAADARDGVVAVQGWTVSTAMTARELAEKAQSWGAAAVLYTDVSRDGMQGGPAVRATAALQDGLEIPVLASGGVGRLADLDDCAAAGIQGVVLGRALYEGAFTIEEALARC